MGTSAAFQFEQAQDCKGGLSLVGYFVFGSLTVAKFVFEQGAYLAFNQRGHLFEYRLCDVLHELVRDVGV